MIPMPVWPPKQFVVGCVVAATLLGCVHVAALALPMSHEAVILSAIQGFIVAAVAVALGIAIAGDLEE